MIISDHASIRFTERYGENVIPSEVVTRILRNDFIIAKKVKGDCREALLVHKNRFIRFIFDPARNKVVTFLPPVGRKQG